jgi:LDH2 family malate/lactate/ureidoglycolate dehydrogenase
MTPVRADPAARPRERYVHPDDARDLAARLLQRHGVPPADAAAVAESLVDADLRGIGTHGLVRLPGYLDRIRRGLVDPDPEFRLERVAAAVALLDGANGLGAVVGRRAMDEAIALARDAGVGLVLVRRSSHFGAAAHYARQAAAAGMASITITNASRALPPWGGREPLLGTSPIAIGAPDATGCLVLDMSPAVAARGKIRAALRRGERLPPGYALDAHGEPTTDPRAALEGTLLPLGGPKGSGLALMFDVLAGVLTGAEFAGDVGDQYLDLDRSQDVGHFFLAIDPMLGLPDAGYLERMRVLEAAVHAVVPAEGFDEVLLPGELEERARSHRTAAGIPYAEAELRALDREARVAGILPLCPSDHEFS